MSAVSKRPTQEFESLLREIRAHRFAPVYALAGEEAFFIDRLAEALIEELLPAEERDFNLVQFYGAETTPDAVMAEARGFPFGAERKVVCLREAQQLKGLAQLELYFKSIPQTTVLIICHKYGAIDRRTKLATLVQKHGVLFEAKPLYANEIPAFATHYAAKLGLKLSSEAAQVVAELLGTDLSKLTTELDKLAVNFSTAQHGGEISRNVVFDSIGMSREFNGFELQDALVKKDARQAMRIAAYFYKNDREKNLIKILPLLFKFFSQLMLAYYAPEKTVSGIAAWLGVKDWQAERTFIPAMRNYTGVKVMQIIAEIRAADARSKGVGVGPASRNEDILTPLVWFILN